MALALAVSFSEGIAGATMYSASWSLFLDSFDAKHMPYVFIAGAPTIMVMGAFFAWVQRRVRTSLYVYLPPLLLIGTIVAARVWFSFQPRPAAFFLAAWMDVFELLTSLSFWVVFYRLLDVQQSKRLFGLLGIGSYFSDIMGGFMTPTLVSLMGTENLLWLSCGGMGLSLVFTFMLVSRHRSVLDSPSGGEEEESASPKAVMKDRYMMLMNAFWFLSIISFFFCETAFNNQAETRYADHELTSFLGLIHGTGSAVLLLMRTLVSGRAIAGLGVIRSLSVLPAGLAVICGVIAISGMSGFMGASMVFKLTLFWALFDRCFRLSMLNPSFRVLAQPLPFKKRIIVQTTTESWMEPAGALAASGLILLTGRLWKVDAFHLAAVLLSVLAVWGLVVWLLRGVYSTTLLEALGGRRVAADSETASDFQTVNFLTQRLRDARMGEVLYALDLLARCSPHSLTPHFPHLLAHSSEEVRLETLRLMEKFHTPDTAHLLLDLLSGPPRIRSAALRALASLSESESRDVLMKHIDHGDPRVVSGAVVAMIRYCGIDGILCGGGRLMRMAESPDESERAMFCHILADVGNPAFFRHVRGPLADGSLVVRHAALAAAEKLKTARLVPEVVQLLHAPSTAAHAIRALSAMGEDALPQLDDFMGRPGLPRAVPIGIVKAAGRVRGRKAEVFLLDHVYFPDVSVREQVLRCLTRRGFHPRDETGFNMGGKLLEREMEETAALLSLACSFPDDGSHSLMRKAMEEEVAGGADRIFDILSSLFNPEAVRGIRRNLRHRDPDRRANAMELLDQVVPDRLRHEIVPLISSGNPEDRLKKLPARHSPARLSKDDALLAVFRRERGWVRPWTRTVAVYTMGLSGSRAFVEPCECASVAGDRSLRETGVWALGMLDASRAVKPMKRKGDTVLITVEKVLLIGSVDLFSGLTGEILEEIAGLADEIHAEKGDVVVSEGEYSSSLYIVSSGELSVTRGGAEESRLKEGALFGERSALVPGESGASLSAVEDSALLVVTSESIYDLMSEEPELARKVIRHLCG